MISQRMEWAFRLDCPRIRKADLLGPLNARDLLRSLYSIHSAFLDLQITIQLNKINAERVAKVVIAAATREIASCETPSVEDGPE